MFLLPKLILKNAYIIALNYNTLDLLKVYFGKCIL